MRTRFPKTSFAGVAGAALALAIACGSATAADEEAQVAAARPRIPVCPPPLCPPCPPLPCPPGMLPSTPGRPIHPAPETPPAVPGPPTDEAPETPGTETPATDTPQLPDPPPQFDPVQNLPTPDSLGQFASTTGNAAPGMIGDEFGGMGSMMMQSGTFIGNAVFPEDVFLGGGFRYLDGISISSSGFGTALGVSSNRDTYTNAVPATGLGNGSGTDPRLSGLVETDFDVTTVVDSGPFTAIRTDQVVSTSIPGTVSGSYNVYQIFRDSAVVAIAIPTPGSGGGASVGRQKIGENTSPLPRDRVFVNYSYFDNTSIFNGVNVSRVTPGFEKTFVDGTASFEARFPFASTLDSDILAGGGTNTDEIEFGNVTLYLKSLLWQGGPRDAVSVSAGIGMTLPTADDVRVLNGTGNPLVVVENEAIHVLPFVGALYTPNDRFFAQTFMQLDVDTNGNTVEAINFGTGNLGRAGIANDTTFLFVDVGVGYWVYRANDPGAFVQGVAPTAELHYNRSLNDADVIVSGPFRVGDFAENIEILNGVLGLNMECRNDLIVTAGYAVPIGGGADQQFDGEFRLIANWFFGATNRRTRGQF